MSLLIRHYLGRSIIIETLDGCRLEGRLLHFSDGNKKSHKPETLVLETDAARVIVRGWRVIHMKPEGGDLT